MKTDAHNIQPFMAIYYVAAAQFLYSFHDIIIKWVSGQYPVHELVLIRSCVSLIPIMVMVRFKGGVNPFKTRNLGGQIIRALLMFGSYICFYLALSALPLAVTVSLFFSNPIFITILSVLVLKEKVKPGAWIALISGFAGVIIMLNPGAGMVDPAAFLALLSALFYAAGSIMTRFLGKTESGESLTVYIMGVYILASVFMALILSRFSSGPGAHPSLAFFLREWHSPPGSDIVLLLGMGLLSSAGIYFLSQGYRLGQPSKIAPFEYIAVPLSVVWGFLFWKDVLALKTFLGIGLIIGSGLYIVQGKKRKAQVAITIKTTCEGIDWEQIPRILKQVNMGYHDPGIHKKAFEQSYAVVFIYNRSRLLGFGRAISDGAYQAAIYDCAVHPDFQGKGLGRIIIKALMATLTGFNIILYASPGKEKFYQKYGFRRMKTGMAFFLDPEKKGNRDLQNDPILNFFKLDKPAPGRFLIWLKAKPGRQKTARLKKEKRNKAWGMMAPGQESPLAVLPNHLSFTRLN